MTEGEYLAGEVERFAKDLAHGIVRVSDGRSLPFDVGACRSYLGDARFLPEPGTKVRVRVGLGRTGVERAIEVRDGTPPPGTGPTVGDALTALVEIGLVEQSAATKADRFLLPMHARAPHGAPTGRDVLLPLLDSLAGPSRGAPGLFVGKKVAGLSALARAASLPPPRVRRLGTDARGFEEEIDVVTSSHGELPIVVPLDAARAVGVLLAERGDPRRFARLAARDAHPWERGGPERVWLTTEAQRARVRARIGEPFALALDALDAAIPISGDARIDDPVLVQVVRGSIDWPSLRDCYGPATDAPAELARLRSPDEDERGDALDGWLYAALLHQGDVSPATAAALPALVEIVEDTSAPDRAGVASAVARIAVDARRHAEATSDVTAPACSVLRVLARLKPRLIALVTTAPAPLDGYALVALATLRAGTPQADVLEAIGAGTKKAELAARLARSTAAMARQLERLDGEGE